MVEYGQGGSSSCTCSQTFPQRRPRAGRAVTARPGSHRRGPEWELVAHRRRPRDRVRRDRRHEPRALHRHRRHRRRTPDRRHGARVRGRARRVRRRARRVDPADRVPVAVVGRPPGPRSSCASVAAAISGGLSLRRLATEARAAHAGLGRRARRLVDRDVQFIASRLWWDVAKGWCRERRPRARRLCGSAVARTDARPRRPVAPRSRRDHRPHPRRHRPRVGGEGDGVHRSRSRPRGRRRRARHLSRRHVQIAYAAIKLPLVMLGTAAAFSAPALTAVSNALGCPAKLAQDLALVVTGLAFGALLLVACTPLVMLGHALHLGYHKVILMVVVIFSIGGVSRPCEASWPTPCAASTRSARPRASSRCARCSCSSADNCRGALRPYLVRPAATAEVVFVHPIEGSLIDAVLTSLQLGAERLGRLMSVDHIAGSWPLSGSAWSPRHARGDARHLGDRRPPHHRAVAAVRAAARRRALGRHARPPRARAARCPPSAPPTRRSPRLCPTLRPPAISRSGCARPGQRLVELDGDARPSPTSTRAPPGRRAGEARGSGAPAAAAAAQLGVVRHARPAPRPARGAGRRELEPRSAS